MFCILFTNTIQKKPTNLTTVVAELLLQVSAAYIFPETYKHREQEQGEIQKAAIPEKSFYGRSCCRCSFHWPSLQCRWLCMFRRWGTSTCLWKLWRDSWKRLLIILSGPCRESSSVCSVLVLRWWAWCINPRLWIFACLRCCIYAKIFIFVFDDFVVEILQIFSFFCNFLSLIDCSWGWDLLAILTWWNKVWMLRSSNFWRVFWERGFSLIYWVREELMRVHEKHGWEWTGLRTSLHSSYLNL